MLLCQENQRGVSTGGYVQHTLYVLRIDKDRWLYTGVTANLTQRLRDHDAGKVASTRHRRPLRLLYTESFGDKKEAWARERYFKTAAGGALRQRLISGQPGDSLLE